MLKTYPVLKVVLEREETMKILFATDGSKYSQRAVEMITNFTFDLPSELKIVTVLDLSYPPALDIYGAGFVSPPVEFEKIARENALKVLEDAMHEVLEKLSAESLTVTTEILLGAPEGQIIETAEKMNADLIIVGSHGYNRWERLLLGSVSASVVQHAPCSVLIVRTPKNG